MRKSAPLTFSRLIRRVGAAEKSTLLTFLLTAVFLYLFAELADGVIEGDTRGFDTGVLLALRDSVDVSDPLGPRWVEEMMRDFSALGSSAVLASITLVVIGFLVLVRRRDVAWMIGLSVTTGTVMVNLLKWAIARPRPDLVPHATTVFTQSFPSSHAMLSALVYLTLGALLARTQADSRVKVYLLIMAGALTVVVGTSRVYLGVHWPTDVLAGWAIGAAWALICWLAMLWLQARGTIDTPAWSAESG